MDIPDIKFDLQSKKNYIVNKKTEANILVDILGVKTNRLTILLNNFLKNAHLF